MRNGGRHSRRARSRPRIARRPSRPAFMECAGFLQDHRPRVKEYFPERQCVAQNPGIDYLGAAEGIRAHRRI